MRKLLWLVLAIWMLVGCDAEVGAEPCTGLRCVEPPPSLQVALMVKYVHVSTAAPLDLPIVSTIESPCNVPCLEPVRLFRAMHDAAWTVVRTGGPPTLRLLFGDTILDTQVPSPEGGASIASLYVNSGRDGQAVAHVSWNLPRGGISDELALIFYPGDMQELRLANSRSRAPRGAIAAPEGFLLFDAPQELKPGAKSPEATPTGTLRLVDNVGATKWQQARLPKGGTYVTSAVALASGFVVGAGEDATKASKFGVLSLDEGGTFTRFGLSSDSSWHATRLLPLGPNSYAVAAESEIDGVVDALAAGNIDVMIDRGNVNTLTGFRLERSCFELSLYGFSADDEGNLYVSSLTGLDGTPRGLLCELPVVGDPRCFQGLPNQLFGDIVANGDGSLFVVAGEQILRVQLPR
jgi:hypothetical protein